MYVIVAFGNCISSILLLYCKKKQKQQEPLWLDYYPRNDEQTTCPIS